MLQFFLVTLLKHLELFEDQYKNTEFILPKNK